jgi:DNA polymerase-3 subunit epsilon
MGGRQTGLDLTAEIATAGVATDLSGGSAGRARPVALPSRLTPAEIAAHAAFVVSLGEQAVWKNYIAEEPAQ